MARNLTRNTKVYVSNQGTLGSCTNANTWEVKVLDGYDFSQGVSDQDISINEAGTVPVRGSKKYNVALNPSEVNFITYIRPYDDSANSLTDAPEKILWASLAGSDATGFTTDTTGNGQAVYQVDGDMRIDFEESDANELAKLYFWFHLENTTYRVDNVNLSSAEISFDIEAIAQISWSGMGTDVTEIPAADHTTIAAWTAGTDFTAVPATTSNSFLRNKLSTITLQDNNSTYTLTESGTAEATSTSTTIDVPIAAPSWTINEWVGYYVVITGGTATPVGEVRVVDSNDADTLTVDLAFSVTPDATTTYDLVTSTQHVGQTYTLALTGGSLTVENNMSFLTPEELAVVNRPLPGFAGARQISGTINAYLNTGNYGTAALLKDILEDIDAVDNSFNMTISVGGSSSTKRVDLQIPTALLVVPTISVEDVIGTEIGFAGQGSSKNLENQDELVVHYIAPTA